MLILVVVPSCSFVAWHEFYRNPMGETERGEWTGKQLFYATVFAPAFLASFLYLPTLYFDR